MADRTEVSSYLIHPALRKRLDEWLEAQGFRVDELPPVLSGGDKLPTFLVSPGGRRIRENE